MVFVYISQMTDNGHLTSRGTNENMALILLSVSIIGFAVQFIKYKREFSLFMLTLCVAFFCREWHFAGTSNGIYVVLVLLAFWAVKRKAQLEDFFKGNAVEVWAWATFSLYLLSQLIARRVFRYVHLLAEEEMHIFLEETVETTGHIVMIITCIVTWIIVTKTKPAEPVKAED
jgi:peptidoglycan/LPS O-acetylase OafA/YrhL